MHKLFALICLFTASVSFAGGIYGNSTETDLIFTNWAKTNTYVQIENDRVFTNWVKTNTYVKLEADNIFTNWVKTNTYIQIENDHVFTNWVKTNTYIQAETDPAFTNWYDSQCYSVTVDSWAAFQPADFDTAPMNWSSAMVAPYTEGTTNGWVVQGGMEGSDHGGYFSLLGDYTVFRIRWMRRTINVGGDTYNKWTWNGGDYVASVPTADWTWQCYTSPVITNAGYAMSVNFDGLYSGTDATSVVANLVVEYPTTTVTRVYRVAEVGNVSVAVSNGLAWFDCGSATGFVFRFTGPNGVTNVYLP